MKIETNYLEELAAQTENIIEGNIKPLIQSTKFALANNQKKLEDAINLLKESEKLITSEIPSVAHDLRDKIQSEILELNTQKNILLEKSEELEQKLIKNGGVMTQLKLAIEALKSKF